MRALRLWAVRHARFFERGYGAFEPLIKRSGPLLKSIGYERLEAPAAGVERTLKSLLFDCQMCGQCALSSTGMSCPMKCPKNLRNGPCGGVREDGMCEVEPEMKCIWVLAWEGSQRMRYGEAILNVQPPVDHSLKGTSSWLRVARGEHARHLDRPYEVAGAGPAAKAAIEEAAVEHPERERAA